MQSMKLIFFTLCLMIGTKSLFAKDLIVETSEQLKSAFPQASAGTKIILLPGHYQVYRLDSVSGGNNNNPITVEASIPGTVIIEAKGSEAISIHHPYWVFKYLTIKGSPGSDHAFHITGNADGIIVKDNSLIDFHAHIKVNGDNDGYPDNGLIENNDIFNSEIRQTGQPVTPIDIVGGKNWVVRGNYIADFSKGLGDQTSYGVFMKGNSSKGIIEKNLIICSSDTEGGIRIGISLGGGGTSLINCENQDCNYEHSDGLIRNNIILNCSDVGIYLNKAHNSVIENNTLLMTVGIDVRFSQSNAIIKDNILTGAIRERDGGIATIEKNAMLGNKYGMWLPTINYKLQNRISDYDIKFPRFLNRKNILDAQSFINDVFSFLEKTSAGLGHNKTKDCFPYLVIGDIKPDKEQCDIFWEDTKMSSDNSEDFWGNKRSIDRNSMGAIDLYNSTCNIVNRIKHKHDKLIEPCLD